MPSQCLLQVHVVSALSGNELMPWTWFPRDDVLSHVRRHLNCRPSRPVTLFHLGSTPTTERPLVLEASWTALELSATVSDAVSADVRDELLRKIISQTNDVGVEKILMSSEAFSDDRIIVLAAVQKFGRVLRVASELCQSDREIVLAAVQQNPDAIQFATDKAKTDTSIINCVASKAIAEWHSLSHRMVNVDCGNHSEETRSEDDDDESWEKLLDELYGPYEMYEHWAEWSHKAGVAATAFVDAHIHCPRVKSICQHLVEMSNLQCGTEEHAQPQGRKRRRKDSVHSHLCWYPFLPLCQTCKNDIIAWIDSLPAAHRPACGGAH